MFRVILLQLTVWQLRRLFICNFSHMTLLMSRMTWLKLFFFFLRESFNLWRPLLMIALYHQTKTPITFWCRWGLNPRFLIQPSEILPVELTGTHQLEVTLFCCI